MKTDVAYEVVDLRDRTHTHLLGVIGVISQVPGGIEIKTNTIGTIVDLTQDDDDTMIQDNGDGTITFNTPEGTIFLEELRLDNWRRRAVPVLPPDQPNYRTDSEVQEAVYNLLRNLD